MSQLRLRSATTSADVSSVKRKRGRPRKAISVGTSIDNEYVGAQFQQLEMGLYGEKFGCRWSRMNEERRKILLRVISGLKWKKFKNDPENPNLGLKFAMIGCILKG